MRRAPKLGSAWIPLRQRPRRFRQLLRPLGRGRPGSAPLRRGPRRHRLRDVSSLAPRSRARPATDPQALAALPSCAGRGVRRYTRLPFAGAGRLVPLEDSKRPVPEMLAVHLETQAVKARAGEPDTREG